MDAIKGEKDSPQIIRQGFAYIVLLILSLLLYFALTKLFCCIKSVELLSYRGINNMGRFPLSQYPSLIRRAYCEWWNHLWNISSIACSPFAIILYRIFTATFVILAIGSIICTIKRDRLLGIFLTGMFIIFPLAVNFIYVMSPQTVGLIMEYGFVVSFFVCISVCENYLCILARKPMPKWKRYYSIGCKLGVVVAIIGLTSIYTVYANVEFVGASFVQAQAHSYYTTLITQIKSTKGYQAGMPIVFVGERQAKDKDMSFARLYYHSGVYISQLDEVLGSYSWLRYMNRWLGFSPPIGNSSEYEDLPEVQEMALYPDDGSIKVIQDSVVVKFSESESTAKGD